MSTITALKNHCTASPATEMALLGCCMMHPEAYHEAAAIIAGRPVFHETKLSKLWQVVSSWYTAHPDTRPDGAYFWDQLEDTSLPSDCVACACLPVSVGFHTRELLRLWKLRRSRDLAATLARAVDCGDTETVEAVRRDIAALDADTDVNTGLVLTDVAAADEVPVPLFDNGIPPAGFGLVIGADGAGKGFLLADVLLSCALGRAVSIPTLSRRGAPLRVLYLSYEDIASILRWRMDRITAAAGMDCQVWRAAQQEGRLSFLCEPEPLYVQSGHDIPKPTEALTRLRQHIVANKTDIVVIDPLSACAVLQNENDNSALNVVACSLRAMAADTGCAVLLVHHTSKAGRLVAGDHQAARGGSALGGAARWCLSLTQSQDDRFLLNASVSKNSYGKRVYDIALSRDPETGVLKEISGEEIGKAKDALLESVIRFVADHPSLELNPNAVRLNCSDAAKKLIESTGEKPKAVFEAIQRAVKCGALVLEERPRANRSGTYEVLTVPCYDDEDGIPF